VTHDLDNKRAWAPCLRVEGVKLPTGYFFGASAATGKTQNNLINIKEQILNDGIVALRFNWSSLIS
jgi:mannose-binding lectin 2